MTVGNFPLRIPSAILSHLKLHKLLPENKPTTYHHVRRHKRQIMPGVYSCGHQVTKFKKKKKTRKKKSFFQGNDMFVNFINPHYPGHDSAAGTCHFRLLKHRPEICQVNLKGVPIENCQTEIALVVKLCMSDPLL